MSKSFLPSAPDELQFQDSHGHKIHRQHLITAAAIVNDSSHGNSQVRLRSNLPVRAKAQDSLSISTLASRLAPRQGGDEILSTSTNADGPVIVRVSNATAPSYPALGSMKLKVFRLHRHGAQEGKLSGSTQDEDGPPDSSELMKRSAPKDTKDVSKVKSKPPRVSKPKKESLAAEEKKQSDLPDCWYYSSGHILINRERAILELPKLRRIKMLDDLARFHAEDMAENSCVFHSVKTAENLKHKLHSKFAGENIQRGKSIRSMHSGMMEKGKRSRDNILSKQFTEFGMGTAMGSDGKLYMVQLFRGPVYD